MDEDKEEKCQCQSYRVLVGWDEIINHLKDIQADKLISLSSPALQAYVDNHGFPTFVTRKGEVATFASCIHHWLISLDKGQIEHGSLN